MADGPKLTYKQILFCQEYCIDGNGTQAAIRAGYSKDSARAIATENLTKPVIKEKIAFHMEQRARAAEITAERVLNEISKLAFSDFRNAYDDNGDLKSPDQIDDDTAAAIQHFEITTTSSGGDEDIVLKNKKLRMYDKKSSLELLGKYLKMFTDKVELSGKDGGPIEQDHRWKVEFVNPEVNNAASEGQQEAGTLPDEKQAD